MPQCNHSRVLPHTPHPQDGQRTPAVGPTAAFGTPPPSAEPPKTTALKARNHGYCSCKRRLPDGNPLNISGNATTRNRENQTAELTEVPASVKELDQDGVLDLFAATEPAEPAAIHIAPKASRCLMTRIKQGR